jgi:hypothetical protein
MRALGEERFLKFLEERQGCSTGIWWAERLLKRHKTIRGTLKAIELAAREDRAVPNGLEDVDWAEVRSHLIWLRGELGKPSTRRAVYPDLRPDLVDRIWGERGRNIYRYRSGIAVRERDYREAVLQNLKAIKPVLLKRFG